MTAPSPRSSEPIPHASKAGLSSDPSGGSARPKPRRRAVPVVIRRNEQARRDPDRILQLAIAEGLEQCGRGTASLALSAVGAGLVVGFSAMAVGITSTMVGTGELPVPLRLAQAIVYPLGFVMCVVSGMELFTEHTATSLYPALDGQSRFRDVLRVWGVVLVGNLIGAAASAALLTLAEPVVGASEGYAIVAHHLVSPSASALFVSSVLAGWLMAMGAWLLLATPPGRGEVVSIFIVTFLIGLGGLHHSIAGTAEAFLGWWVAGAVGPLDVLAFVAVAAPGNLVGGSVFVALLNHGHLRGTRLNGDDT